MPARRSDHLLTPNQHLLIGHILRRSKFAVWGEHREGRHEIPAVQCCEEGQVHVLELFKSEIQ
jgi:hypothetical protein